MQARVGAGECEIGGGVIEVPGLPVACAVAACAWLPVAACVGIVLEMTTDAFALGVGEQLGAMAVLAFDQSMTANEREASLVMLMGGLLPVLFGVAGLAVAAQPRLVDVVPDMTIDAG